MMFSEPRWWWLLLLAAGVPRPAGADRIQIHSPVQDFVYVDGAEVWLSLHLEADPTGPLASGWRAYALCTALDGALTGSGCVDIADQAPLAQWVSTDLTDGPHEVCAWLAARDKHPAEDPHARSCVTFRTGPAPSPPRRAGVVLIVVVRCSQGRHIIYYLSRLALARRVLGVKFGQHGDDGALSVAVDGVLVSKLDLEAVWAAAHPTDAALGVYPGGFCGGCGPSGATDALSVSRAGVCETCVPFEALVDRWEAALAHVFSPADLETFDAVVCASAPEDMRDDRAAGALRRAVERLAGAAIVNPLDQNARGGRVYAIAYTYVPQDPALAGRAEAGSPSQAAAAVVEDARRTSAALAVLARTKGKPFSVCRPGWGWELTLSHRYRFKRRLPTEHELTQLHHETGIYAPAAPATHAVRAAAVAPYFEKWNDAMDRCDAIVAFPATIQRARDYLRPGHLFLAGAHILGGAYFDIENPADVWLTALVGQRVLVVHQHAELMVARFRNETLRRALWPAHPHALPDFAAVVGYVPVDAIDNKRPLEPDWRAATEKMCGDVGALAGSFDVALVAAGGYGHLLVHCIRHAHQRSAVYVGGALPFHFGLLSHRHLNDPLYARFVNEHFIRPPRSANYTGRNVGGYV